MTVFTAPVDDIRFTLEHVAGVESLAALPGYEDASLDMVEAILTEAGKFADQVLAPLNWPGDQQGAKLENGVVRMPEGWKDAYDQYVEGGWNTLSFDPDFGGQGLPQTLAVAAQETWHAANMSWMLCPMLTVGAVEALEAWGDDAQKAAYLPKLVSGEWAGTMNLTEPQAGSDVGALKTKAEPAGDGSWKIAGSKIFITYGDHELTENVIHLVLARTPGAPDGTKGISLFVVPKYLVNDDGSLGARNDVRCVSLEHKLGIHASPTCVMSFGDGGGAAGWLLGEENKGMACMFTMMNSARLNVGIEGLAITERAFQAAVDYARGRVQSKDATGARGESGSIPIIGHPDVRRMLMTMRAATQAMRGLVYFTAARLDEAKKFEDADARAEAQARADLLIPVVKAWCTDLGVEMASVGLQVHGGMGYVEETGAAQHYRDARIAPIYEGTNGIQAIDLIGRKVARDGGAAAKALIEEMKAPLGASAEITAALTAALADLDAATDWIVERFAARRGDTLAGAHHYLNLWGLCVGGWTLAKASVAASNGADYAPAFKTAKAATARFYAEAFLPQTGWRLAALKAGSAALDAVEDDAW